MTALIPHRGALILVLGILSFLVCPVCGAFAWAMGKRDMQEMDAGQMDPEGRSMTQAGKVLGMVSIALTALSVAITLVVLFLMLLGVFAAAGAG